MLTTAADPQDGRLDATAVALAALAGGVLAVRCRWPIAVLLISAAAAEVYLVQYQEHQGSVVLAAPLIALYTVADTSSRRRSLVIGVFVILVFAGIHMLVKPSAWLGSENLALAALGGLAMAAGEASRNRRAYLAEAQARVRQAEADRDFEAARRVTEERLRIARDLHDAVGHHLALIHVQAAVATHVLDKEPERADTALAHIRAASKTALGELTDTIALLRQPDEQATPTEPATGLAGVKELLTSFRRGGLTIAEHIEGPVRPIAVATDLTVYRLIQESLTNVYKHAGPTNVDVRVAYQSDTLRIVIDNAAPNNPVVTATATATKTPNGSGHGLIGMRERVTALGGSLHAGPRPDGGYRVSATLPIPAGSPP